MSAEVKKKVFATLEPGVFDKIQIDVEKAVYEAFQSLLQHHKSDYVILRMCNDRVLYQKKAGCCFVNVEVQTDLFAGCEYPAGLLCPHCNVPLFITAENLTQIKGTRTPDADLVTKASGHVECEGCEEFVVFEFCNGEWSVRKG